MDATEAQALRASMDYLSVNTSFHSGDYGDCLAALPTIRQLGGGKIVLGKKDGKWGRFPMTRERFDVIAPLLRAQEYVSEVIFEDDYKGEITHDFHNFRTKPPPQHKGAGELGYNLATWQANWFGIKPEELDLSPWLKATPDNPAGWHKASFARSLRYQNPCFPWRKIFSEHLRAIFIGTPDEHKAFPVITEYCPTDNLYDAAGLILGSDIFIGNQSSPCWIALGLGHKLIQEMDQCLINRNSVIERENAQYIG